jgi:MoaA/NifB/PqqE/SkfB family radical SAM enzyme
MIDFKFLQKILPRLYSFLPFYLAPRFSLPPVQAFFEVTYRCNLRCDMCHYLEIIEETESKKTYKNEMSSEEVKKAISKLPRFSLITFTGGEAFMKSDFMDILEFATKRHKVHIITNGTTLSDKVVEDLMRLRLKSTWGSGLFYMGVSLEGGEELHDTITTIPGSFKKTTQGLERLVARRKEMKSRFPLIHVTCVINRGNVRELVPLYEYSCKLGVNVANYVLSSPATYWHGKDYDQDEHLQRPTIPVEEIEPNLLREQLELLQSKSKENKTQLRFSPNYITVEEIVRYYSNKSSYQDYRCYIPWTKVAFSAYGDVFSCPHYRVGNVNDGDSSPAWQSDRIQGFREKLKTEGIFPGCLGCCQSEYVGSTPLAGEAITESRVKRVEFLKVKESGCSAPAFHREGPEGTG